VELDGLNAVAVLVAPGNMFTGPKMKLAFYVDNNANQEQSNALSNIFSGRSGGFFAVAAQFIGEVVGVKSAPITFGVEGTFNLPDKTDTNCWKHSFSNGILEIIFKTKN
jgi:hypothetical protein